MVENNPISTLLVDDHSLVTELISKYLPLQGAFTVDVVGSARECHEKIKSEGAFDVVLLDILLPERLSLDGVSEIVKANAEGAVALFSGNVTEEFVHKCLDVGALGFIPKTLSLRSLASSITLVASGEPFVPAGYFSINSNARTESESGLNADELAILEKLGQGLANKEIMALLSLTESTVKMRVRSLCRKLGARNRTHAVIVARENGLL
jgi:two-component system nitrate/nitrite response regulator NarP